MPHIILEGPVDLKVYFDTFQPVREQSDTGILKIRNVFANRNSTILLIEGIAVEEGHLNTFFVQLNQKGDSTTVHLYPGTDPEKTPGVKKILALIACSLKEQDNTIRYGNTNLMEFLPET